ncbi:lanthionine synthetase LanC family protein [Longispora urticae]
MVAAGGYRDLGEAAWAWVLGHVRDDDGPWLPVAVADGWRDEAPPGDRDSLYAGIAGLAPVLAEIAQVRALTGAERELSDRIAARLRAGAAVRAEPSWCDGLAGDATALRLLSPGAEALPLRRLAELATPTGWRSTLETVPGSDEPVTDLISGTAGIVLAAVWAGGLPADRVGDGHAARITAVGGEALLRAADPTEHGLDWAMVPGRASRAPNYSHGTAGVGAALAVAGAALNRPEFVAAAVEGARHLLAVGSLDGGGFVVPHTIPPSTREVEPVTYTWCHGPTGTSYLFAALAHAGVAEVGGFDVAELRRRCLRAVLTSGVPARLRPGFWDNDGRCCGTAGVGDALLDAAQDTADPAWADTLLRGALTMGDALVDRAFREHGGAYWRFVEHRRDPSLLPPGTSWMQGAAGIAAYLFRLARVVEGGLGAPVVDRPDQWWGVPAHLRAVHTA